MFYEALLKGLLLGLILSFAAGPVVFTIIKVSLRHGRKVGYALISGVSLSDIMMVLFANLAAEAIQQLLHYKTLIGIIGACLLIGIGIYSLFFGKDPKPTDSEEVTGAKRKAVFKYAIQGFLVNAINPATIFFWLTTSAAVAFMPQKFRIIMFVTCLITVLSTDILKVSLANKLRLWLSPKTIHILHQASAIIIITLGVLLALNVSD